MILLYTKYDSERIGQSVYDILLTIFDDIILNIVIFLPIYMNLIIHFQSLAIQVEHFINFQLQNHFKI